MQNDLSNLQEFKIVPYLYVFQMVVFNFYLIKTFHLPSFGLLEIFSKPILTISLFNPFAEGSRHHSCARDFYLHKIEILKRSEERRVGKECRL